MPVGKPPEPTADLSFLGPRRGLRARRVLASPWCQVLDVLVLCAVAIAVQAREAAVHGSSLTVGVAQVGNLFGLTLLVLGAITWHFLLVLIGLYSRSQSGSAAEYLFRLLIGVNCCASILGLVELVTHHGAGLWANVMWFWLGSAGGMAVFRLVAMLLYPMLTRSHPRRTIVVGVGELARKAEKQCRCDPRCRMVGIIEAGGRPRPGDSRLMVHSGSALLGTLDDLEHLLAAHRADIVIVALPFATHFEQVGRIINACQRAGVESHYLTSDPATTRSSTPPETPRRPQPPG